MKKKFIASIIIVLLIIIVIAGATFAYWQWMTSEEEETSISLKVEGDTSNMSAKIDGAGWLTTIVKITLPLIKKVLLFVCVANTTSNILLFVPMQVITDGGPQSSTNVLMFEAYRCAFKYGDRPRASAIVTILLILIIGICLIQAGVLNEKEGSERKRRKGR